ncbi:MAG: hypothetical protein COA47_16155 [Robiginitomaculum sp.]|nr:MAG: hypothetical protein COA47_16155 [Robiginitomaculum sp.]
MILRRVIKHFSNQEWTAIFLDFLIVVVGVFVGLQVNNWNEAQESKRTAREYIVRIQEDLLANQKDMKRRVEYFGWVKNHALGAMAALEHPPEELGEQFIIDAYQASQSLPRRVGRDTYDELLSVGGINTIRGLMVRQRLAQYYRAMYTLEGIFMKIPSYREALRRSMPYEAQSVFRAEGCANKFGTDKTGAPVITVSKKCDLGLTQEQTSAIVARLIKAELESDLIRVLSDIDLKIQLFQVQSNRAGDLNTFLEESK